MVGDYGGSYRYATPVNGIVAEAVGLNATVVTLAKETIKQWARKD